MTNTERKLDEARFFLDKLKTHDPYFDYYLSAFLNAARSTSWVMRHEFQGADGWEEWYKESTLSDGQRKLLKETNELRIETTKKSGIKTDYHLIDGLLVEDEKYYPMIKDLLDSEAATFTLTLTPLEEIDEDETFEDEETISLIVKKVSEMESPTTREKLSKLCSDYFNFLQQKVEECTDLFT